ncbi:CU044_5270 family protein [Streptomyces sp. NPDC058603]|uniref:CU044_5270 family protein n=1 Tax=Streptomyces sp. NPDC058603 TaxID=3346551 RepID=UPI003668CB88
MNANPSRQHPADMDESAQLMSRTARDLPPGRHQFHKERLMAQIHDIQQNEARTATPAPAPASASASASASAKKTRRLPRPAIALPAMAAVVAGVIVTASVLDNGGGGNDLASGPVLTTDIGSASADGVPQLLDRISLAASSGTTHPNVRPGQFIYIESKTAGTFVKTVDGKSSLAGNPLSTRQSWMSADGTKGWLIDPAVNDSPEGETLSLPDEQGNPRKADLNGPSYDYLTKLTTDPDQLLAKIYKETAGHGNSPDQQAFSTIGDLLGESYPPAKLYSALFKTAAKIPGVVVVNDAVDAAGRPGVAVARTDETSGAREEWIFDKKTHAFLGERSVQVKQMEEDGVVIKPGTVNNTSAIITRAVVDEMKQTPSSSWSSSSSSSS